ncbi:glycosyltransferase family 2 protein [Butyrivibrio sp. WCD2001]|uniref:glycosyltransferase family 2 protein n=1 Tax=Butyrivibrio sp. WCD2001 TaxID=1280681 RepID=UPI00041EF8FA|nr:glycosyltransferase family 2 protein [Butyrivibrio sp. WCD2001]
MEKPKITIITITYNAENTIERAIKSVLGQKYENLEYIIVDGLSSDNTLNIVEKYKNHITKIISEPDEGISDAFNKGILAASGDIIGIVNADDWLESNALEMVSEAYDAQVDVYRFNIFLIDEKKGIKAIERPTLYFSVKKPFVNVCHQGTFVSKNAYLKYGMYDIKLKYKMDWDILLRFSKDNAHIKYIDRAVAYYSLDGLTFRSRDNKTKNKESIYILKKHGANNCEIVVYFAVKLMKYGLKKVIPINQRIRMKKLFGSVGKKSQIWKIL